MSRYTDWTSGEPIEKEWAMTGPTDPALRAAAQEFIDHVSDAATWNTPGPGCDAQCAYAKNLRAALAAAEAAPLDVERLARTGVNVWGWDISRARQYAETFAREYAALAAVDAGLADVAAGRTRPWSEIRDAALRSPDTETAGEAG
jgi:hypothetical protein